jgi:hypothetical protein
MTTTMGATPAAIKRSTEWRTTGFPATWQIAWAKAGLRANLRLRPQ